MSVAVNNLNRPGSRVVLTADVKFKDGVDSFWKQSTELISVSRSGAGFYLARKCEVGRLVSLMVPMPKHLRGYDFERELYRVWGLVQHCSRVSGAENPTFQVGVAFIGKEAPRSYNENPLQSYRVAGMNPDGMWRILEARRDFVTRRHARFPVALEVILSAQDYRRNLITDEAAKTANISKSGAAVFSTLKVDVGDSVKFDSVEHNFSALAIVRNRQESDFEPPRLHLEFVNAEFPVETLAPVDKNAALKENKKADPMKISNAIPKESSSEFFYAN